MTFWLHQIVDVFFIALAFLCASEMLKKFVVDRRFDRRSDRAKKLDWQGGGDDFKPAMWKIVLEQADGRPFVVKVGFDLQLPLFRYLGLDYYGYIESNDKGVAVFSTWLGRSACTFRFLTTSDPSRILITVLCEETERPDLPATARFKPHWWQRLGFFA